MGRYRRSALDFGYILCLTTTRIYARRFAASLIRACSRDDPECGARRGVLRRETARRGRFGTSRSESFARRTPAKAETADAGDGKCDASPLGFSGRHFLARGSACVGKRG